MTSIRLHRGNISSATFANDYQYFITSSGSFSRNHDNSIVISKCSLAQDLFIKSIHSFSNAHGKFKGVMNVKSSNSIGDNLLISCGNQDDGRIIIWDIENRESVSEVVNFNQNEELKDYGKGVFYFLNLIVLDDVRFFCEAETDFLGPGAESIGAESVRRQLDCKWLDRHRCLHF
jgi:WD40 repeat protein